MATSDVQQPGWRWRPWRLNWPWRKRTTEEALLPALAQYHSLERHRLRNFLGLGAMMLFCLIYGFFFSAFVPTYFAFFMFPLGVLGLLVIWALPEVNWAPTRAMEKMFFATFVALIVWPNYLAIALPGLPWITLLRLTAFPMVLLFLTCLSMSGEFRAVMRETLSAMPAIPILLAIFVFIQVYTLAFSHSVSSSIQSLIVSLTTQTAVFFAAVYVFREPGQIKRWGFILWAMAIYVSLIAIVEYRVGHLLWRDHIPGFLRVSDDTVERILNDVSMRAGTTRYRTKATFTTPLGLAEYIALTLPFVLHFTTRRFPSKVRLAAACSLPVLLYADYLTDAKLGTIGALIAIIAYVFASAYQNWRRNKSSLVAASFLYGSPLGVGMVGALMLISHRFAVLILGNDGSHANSTNARIDQYHIGFGKLMEWPFGYGIGQAGETLGFGQDIAGMITIDTYYLSVLLDYGVLGFIVYYGMFAIAIYEAARRVLLSYSENEDRSFILPIGISLVVFIIIKSVFSQTDNHPVVFMMLGALVAIVASYKRIRTPAKSRKSRPVSRATIRTGSMAAS